MQLQSALEGFAAQRSQYFRQAEAEVVHLALAVSRKILQREAKLDPDLLAALVRIALDKMGAGPVVRIRVAAGELAAWQAKAGFADTGFQVELVAEATLDLGECVVETDLGTAHLGFEAQLKEVEEGMLDLLALRPQAVALLRPDRSLQSTAAA